MKTQTIFTARFILTVSIVAVSLCALQACAPQLKLGGLTGEMVTRSVLLFGNGSVTLLDVPNDQYFILTQACFTTGDGTNFRLNGVGGADGNNGGVDSEPQVTLDNTDCKEFVPGLVYHPGDAVVFRNNGSDAVRFYINGVLVE